MKDCVCTLCTHTHRSLKGVSTHYFLTPALNSRTHTRTCTPAYAQASTHVNDGKANEHTHNNGLKNAWHHTDSINSKLWVRKVRHKGLLRIENLHPIILHILLQDVFQDFAPGVVHNATCVCSCMSAAMPVHMQSYIYAIELVQCAFR